jgi:hypothetical protein
MQYQRSACLHNATFYPASDLFLTLVILLCCWKFWPLGDLLDAGGVGGVV